MIDLAQLRQSLIDSGFLNASGGLSQGAMSRLGNSAFGSYGGTVDIGTGSGPSGSDASIGPAPGQLDNRWVDNGNQWTTRDFLGPPGTAPSYNPNNFPVFGDNVSIPNIVRDNLPSNVQVGPIQDDAPAPVAVPGGETSPIDIGDQDPGGVFGSYPPNGEPREPLFTPSGAPKAGTSPPVSTGTKDGGLDIGAILSTLPSIFGKGDDMTTALTADEILKKFPDLFKGTSAAGGTATANNSLVNELGGMFGDIGNTVLNLGATNYAADKALDANREGINFAQGVYDNQVDRLEPFRQAGIGALGGVNAEANANPELYNMFAGQNNVNPNTNVQGPNASRVDVNQVDLFDTENPFLRAAQDEGARNLTNMGAARGKSMSGGMLDELNKSGMATYLNYVPTLQSVSSARDNAALAANQQGYNQELGSANFDQGQQRENIRNQFFENDQLFNQFLGGNQFNQGADTNRFNQFMSAASMGGNAAANQGNGSTQLSATGSGLLENMGDIRGARTDGYVNALAGYF